LIGYLPGTLESPRISPILPLSEEDAVFGALKKNPDVVAADFAVESAEADISGAKGALLPQVDIVGSASHAREQSLTDSSSDNSSTILARVTIPLYRAGIDYSKSRAAEQTAVQRKLEFDDARNRAREQAVSAWQSLTTAHAAKAGWHDVVTATQAALKGVKMESKFGTRTTLDVLNAEQELFDARINLVRLTYEEILAMLQLKAAVGELTIEGLRLKVAPYDPVRHYNTVRNKWVGFSGEWMGLRNNPLGMAVQKEKAVVK
jgi:outer membrane protein